MEFTIYNHENNKDKLEQLDNFLNTYNIEFTKEMKPNKLYIVYNIYNSDDNFNSVIYQLLNKLRI